VGCGKMWSFALQRQQCISWLTRRTISASDELVFNYYSELLVYFLTVTEKTKESEK